jgi:hypothetical protein
MDQPRISATYYRFDNGFDKNLVMFGTALVFRLLSFVCYSFIPSLLGSQSQNWVLDRRWHNNCIELKVFVFPSCWVEVLQIP